MKPQVQADELNHEIIDVDHGDMGRLVLHTIYTMRFILTEGPSQHFTKDGLRDSLHPFL